ncbi:hypothetical protein C7999DRAFT_35323 [Corynascus novoguineensis]|uniref:Siderophore biosynthesis n=1 Tax=Corynascus novoguineensis TaxID=1126955 RepID=A0AAN7HGB4_9PEZI|nr:hypothetical protein C7999DRAFT_35323 [Corynascus novoguineensis]
MVKLMLSALGLLMLTTPALSACTGMHTFGACADGIVHWYDPDTGEICDPLDCGGGRAPVKTDVPGCAAYEGTLTPETSPSYMPCWTGFSSASSASSTAETTTSNSPSRANPTSSSPATSVSSGSAESQVNPTTGGASSNSGSSAALTTSPPASTPSANANGAGSSSGAAGSSSSTTIPSSAGRIMSGSWIAMVAGVAIGALAVI